MPELDFLPVLGAIAPVFVILAFGLGARWSRLLPAACEDAILKVVLNVLYPCLVFDKILGNDQLRDPVPLLWAAGAGFLLVTTLMLVGRALAGPMAGIKAPEGRGTFAMASGIQNYGFFAIPVLLSVYPEDRAAHGLLFVHSIGVEVAMWTVGMTLLRGAGGGSFRSALNVPLFAIAAALILNAFGFRFPSPVTNALHQLGTGCVPIGIFTIGFTTAGLLRGWRPRVRVCATGVLVRLLIAPSLFLGGLALLPFPEPVRHLLIIQAAMPAAIMPIVLARAYGGRPGIAIEVAAATSVLSIFTIPLVIALAKTLLEGG